MCSSLRQSDEDLTYSKGRVDESRDTTCLRYALQRFYIRRVQLDDLQVLLDPGRGDGFRNDRLTQRNWKGLAML